MTTYSSRIPDAEVYPSFQRAISVRIDVGLFDHLNDYCERHNIKRNRLINAAIYDYLARHGAPWSTINRSSPINEVYTFSAAALQEMYIHTCRRPESGLLRLHFYAVAAPPHSEGLFLCRLAAAAWSLCATINRPRQPLRDCMLSKVYVIICYPMPRDAYGYNA